MALARLLLLTCVLFILPIKLFALPAKDYLPDTAPYNQLIPTPEKVLGVEIGQRHLMHYQVLQYLSVLADKSPRIMKTRMGETAQHREQILLTISSPENLAKLPEILANRDKLTKPKENEPLVIWLGYSVHGDEISGTHASLVVAYYLAATQDKHIEDILANTIIVIEPSLNPDGMDRFANWATTFRSTSDNPDPQHIEHHQNWPTGRTNHYWFDLNRDWLLLTQQETQNRLKYFYQYQPNVLGDFHEMGSNSSYFFQPGIPSRTNPLTPKKNTELTKALAQFHAAALDERENLYVSEENFDDFYYGKGSTYPDINGGIGILFEQASSRGYQVDTINGLLTFEFGIQNQVLTSLSTINGAWHYRKQLEQYRYEFYQLSKKEAAKGKVKGYLVHEPNDSYRLNAFLDKLKQHQIKAYPLTEDYQSKTSSYKASNSYFIPLEQKQYRVLRALFNQATSFPDNTFYDVSGWTLPLAMDIEFQSITRTRGLKWSNKAWQEKTAPETKPFVNDAYAYAFKWSNFLAPKLLNQLLVKDIKLRVATKAFTSVINGKSVDFSAGTIVIPAGIQQTGKWREIVKQAGKQSNIELFNIKTGLTPKGADLGSRTLIPVDPVHILLVGGKGISQYEAGEIRYYLDNLQGIPVSIVDKADLTQIDWSQYSDIIFVDGNYSQVSEKAISQLKAWVKSGGVVIGQKRAAKWLADNDLLKVNFVSKAHLNGLFNSDDLAYQDKEALSAKKRIAGAIFSAKLDTSHPLAYGYDNSLLPVFRNSTLIMEMPNKPFATVAKYTESPLISGYTHDKLVTELANHPMMVGQNYGEGRVIATTDVLTFRGYWLGSAKLLANSIFFAKAFDAPTN